ncbi:hypothetical protein [Stenotrophomonas maltophilia group sp. Smal35]|uniref:hypothetical protein n=1 Tax=Stenotrophomonas maltophilia group sp. Smal35 TaxID=3377163 RepID=UPI0025545E41|nr:hypothetical protein [Stenotrophomonas maltophilia]
MSVQRSSLICTLCSTLPVQMAQADFAINPNTVQAMANAPGSASRRVTSAAPIIVSTENMMANANSGWPNRN